MRTPLGSKQGAKTWGLGVFLYAPTDIGDFIFGHHGANESGINASARLPPDAEHRLIILVSRHPSLTTEIGSEWVIWQSRVPDIFAFESIIDKVLKSALGGLGVILVSPVLVTRRRCQILLPKRLAGHQRFDG